MIMMPNGTSRGPAPGEGPDAVNAEDPNARRPGSHGELRPLMSGVIAHDADGNLFGVLAFDVLDGQVHAIRSVVNPDKLQHLGATSDAFLRPDRKPAQ